MNKENSIKLFNDKKIRKLWDSEKEKYYFLIVDVVAILTNSDNPRRYWSDLKIKIHSEGSELYEKIVQLKMPAADGKMRLTDAADTKQLLQLIQSIPSPNSEPFKMWLAQVGRERIDETADPELAIDRALETYLKKGKEYAILTDEISKAWSGLTTKKYKELKGLHKENLRDNMTNAELVLIC